MPLSKERKLYAAVLGIAATAFAGDRLFSGGATGPAPANAAPATTAAAPAAPAAPPRPAPPTSSEKTLASRLGTLAPASAPDTPEDLFHSTADWLTQESKKEAAKADAGPDEFAKFASEHRLTSVVVGRVSGAMIDGRYIAVGDDFLGFRLKDVTPAAKGDSLGSATFERDDRTVSLTVDPRQSHRDP